MNFKIGFILALFLAYNANAQQVFPYKNPSLPIDQRVEDLLSRMTAEEKFWQLFMIPGDLENTTPDQYRHGIFGFQVSAKGSAGDAAGQMLKYNATESGLLLAKKINSIQKYFIEKSRLGIPIIAFDEALHGLVREGATSFPQSIALASTFDTALMSRVAAAIAIETRNRGIRQILTPVVNIANDVRWGRTEETYGEDPFLSAEMGVAFVSQFERRNIITTPKHFLANVGDGGRDSYPIDLNERLLRETHLVPFYECVTRGGSRSIMTSYNSINGSPATSNDWLLNKVLKDEWKFKGFVISDASAVGGANVLHFTAKYYPQAGQQAITNGLDVIFQTAYDHYKLFIPPFLDGGINSKRIDDAVRRVLRAKFELGLFENPYVAEDSSVFNSTVRPHKKVALDAATKSFVLLKNKSAVLPFTSLKSIAVIGPDAVEARLGGYSGPGVSKVSILDGIKLRAGKNIVVRHAAGPGRHTEEWRIIPEEFLKTSYDQSQTSGLLGEYFDNLSFEGKPVMTRNDKQINFHWTLYSPSPGLPNDHYAVRWRGKLVAPVTGKIDIGLEGNEGFRLYLDGKLLIDRWRKVSFGNHKATIQVIKGREYDIRVEFQETAGNAHCRLVWNYGVTKSYVQQITEAVELVKKSDVAVIVAGIHEGEFQDRAMLSLPGHQEELILKAAATGRKVVVLLVGGSAITMSNWLDKVDAVLNVWYPGEEGGHAIASTLFGDASPSGRLPITYPLHEAQLPLTYNHKPTGRGDDYHNLSGLPLFPFGYGLSYSSFSYENLELSKQTMSHKDSATVSFTLTNTGRRRADEVVQLYVRDLLSSVVRPVLELKGFQRVTLEPGESRRVQFAITQAMFEMLNLELEKVVEPGDFRIMIGSSSRDLPLKVNIRID